MKDIARQIRSIVALAEPQLSRMNHDETGFKPFGFRYKGLPSSLAASS